MTNPYRPTSPRRRRVTSRRGFIIFFGYRSRNVADGQPAIETICPACREASFMHGRCMQPWFTLFFIPIFPMQSRRASKRFSQCGTCKQMFGLPLEQLAQHVKTIDAPRNDHASAIRIYNELRDNPADSERMIKLLSIYDAMDELREAESSARAYPVAFNADPRCAQILDGLRQRVALAKEATAAAAT